MASTSAQMASDSSPSMRRCLYDVFLSFKGEDTRHNFTDHLYTDLVRRGIITFRDDKLKRGEEIQSELLKAIEESRSSIVVFSQNYADSRWCLEELAKIMECRKEYGQIVLPIFYYVDPSDIRKQRGSFGEAFTTKYDYEENWRDKVERWREALTQAGNISGWHIKQGYESEHIREITTGIANRILNFKSLFVEDNIVGMDSHFQKLSLGLRMESNDVRIVGICGIGGIGKTTIARYVYNQISWGFECCSFLEKVSEVHKNKGLVRLQNQLLNDMLDGGNQKISNVFKGANMRKYSLRFRFRKALIVFDDIDDIDDTDLLECLVGNHDWYGKGRRIIITTRDKHLLTMLKVDYLYEVEELNSNEALKLFSQYAFRLNLFKEDFESLLDRVMHYCQGLPLALKVLGSLLCDKTISEWESELHKLEKEPEVKIQKVLKISFDGSDDTQKVVFLDIACFFKGEDREFVSKILDGCKLYGEINIRVLWERCLITISHDRIYMHDLIQKMGWKIVQQQYPEEPSKWSRLWNPSDIYSAFISTKGMKNVETISLELSRSKEMRFTEVVFADMKKMFANMKKLRLLKVYYNDHHSLVRKEYKTSLPEGFEFPCGLRYLHWEGLESLPSNFDLENLVAINLKGSNIKKLWKGKKNHEKLKFFDVSNSQQLMKMPKFSSMPRLERLNLEGCARLCSLRAFHAMKFLRELNLGRTEIKELPSNIGSLSSLEILNLSRCSKLEKFPEIQGNMKCLRILYLDGTAIKELPSSISCLEALSELYLSGCSKFEKFPEIQGNMKCLRILNFDGTTIKELPSSISCLEALSYLSLRGCSNFEKFPEIQRTMECLEKLSLYGTTIKELPDSIDHLTGLIFLCLENCQNLSGLPSSIYGLKDLDGLYLNGCSNLEALPDVMVDMGGIYHLYASGTAMTELPSSIGRLKKLKIIELTHCENLFTLPDSVGNFTSLSYLRVRNCSKLHKLPDSLRSLQCCLGVLDLAGCNLMEGAIPSDLWCLSSLKILYLRENNICRIPVGITQLPMLEDLRVNHCLMLKEIPELPSRLRSIQAHGCPCLKTLSSDPTHLLWFSLLNNFKLLIENLRCNRDCYLSDYDSFHIFILGSCGIPKWVTSKSMGCEVSIELSKNWYEDDNFLGFAIFFHLLPLDGDDDNNNDDADDKFKRAYPLFNELSTSHGDQSKLIFRLSQHIDCRSYIIRGLEDSYRYVKFPRVYHKVGTSDPTLSVLYVPQTAIASSTEYRSREWNHFEARCNPTYRCCDKTFKVKSCGIHLLYAQAQAPDKKRHDHQTEDDPHLKISRHV